MLALALAFHRAPTQHADLLHGRTPLPAGIGVLLKLAGGSEPDPAILALAPADELKAAALFFIEQVLFRRDASHYQVLGLTPDATLEQVKEHHRLLMRVFHPDRENRADDWKDAFATRINLAYTTLRDADERRRYDASLQQPRPPGAPLPARRAAGPQRPPARQRAGVNWLPPFLLRHLPQWVLAGSALVATGVVGLVYLSNPQPTAMAPTPTASLTGSEPAVRGVGQSIPAAESPATENPPSPAEPGSQARSSASVESRPPATAPALPSIAAEKRVTVAAADPPPLRLDPLPPRPDEPSAAAPTGATAAASSPPAVVVPLKTAASLEPARTVAALPPAAETRDREPAPRPAAVSDRPAQTDADATLARFMTCYERGDTQALMALFDEVAIGPAGGKPQIRREHESLFDSTSLRHLAIDRMTWKREGDWVRGEGHYRATQMRKGEQWLRTETGTIRIELQQRSGRALIMGLDYQPGERS
jgi:hypothetical protein